MSLVQKISPVGIDTTLDSIQVSIYNHLVNTTGWTNYESYPRAYKNAKDGNVIPEHYDGENDYFELLFNDKFNVTSFFLIEDTINSSDEEVFTQRVSMIFQAILPALYPSVLHRADAEMHNNIFQGFSLIDTEIKQLATGVDNVYKDLTLRNQLKEKINLTDMSDLHVVRFDFDVNFVQNCNYSQL